MLVYVWEKTDRCALWKVPCVFLLWLKRETHGARLLFFVSLLWLKRDTKGAPPGDSSLFPEIHPSFRPKWKKRFSLEGSRVLNPPWEGMD